MLTNQVQFQFKMATDLYALVKVGGGGDSSRETTKV